MKIFEAFPLETESIQPSLTAAQRAAERDLLPALAALARSLFAGSQTNQQPAAEG